MEEEENVDKTTKMTGGEDHGDNEDEDDKRVKEQKDNNDEDDDEEEVSFPFLQVSCESAVFQVRLRITSFIAPGRGSGFQGSKAVPDAPTEPLHGHGKRRGLSHVTKHLF